MKHMIVDDDTIFNISNEIDSSNIYTFTRDSLHVIGWKYEASYRVKYIDSLSIDLKGQWRFDDESLSTHRVIDVNDRDTLTVNSYSEFVWNNFLNKQEVLI